MINKYFSETILSETKLIILWSTNLAFKLKIKLFIIVENFKSSNTLTKIVLE